MEQERLGAGPGARESGEGRLRSGGWDGGGWDGRGVPGVCTQPLGGGSPRGLDLPSPFTHVSSLCP